MNQAYLGDEPPMLCAVKLGVVYFGSNIAAYRRWMVISACHAIQLLGLRVLNPFHQSENRDNDHWISLVMGMPVGQAVEF